MTLYTIYFPFYDRYWVDAKRVWGKRDRARFYNSKFRARQVMQKIIDEGWADTTSHVVIREYSITLEGSHSYESVATWKNKRQMRGNK